MKGKIVLHEETDRILEEYGFLKVTDQEYEALDKEYLLRVRKEPFGIQLPDRPEALLSGKLPGDRSRERQCRRGDHHAGERRDIMSGLLAKDLELLKVNMKTYLAVFLIGFMYLIVQTRWKHLLRSPIRSL